MPVEETENEIRVRVAAPGMFQSDSFRRIALSAARGIYAIVGRPKGSSKTKVQSLRFMKSKGWDKKKAAKWARSHGYAPKSYEDGEEYELEATEDISLHPDDFESSMWAEWDEEKDLEPKDVVFKLVGPIEKFEREFDEDDGKGLSGVKGFRIIGHANVACNEDGTPHVDRDREIVEWQALQDSIKDYMANPVLRFMHGIGRMSGQPIAVGRVTNAEMDHVGLLVDAKIGRNHQWLMGDIEDGIYSSFSIGFKVKEISEYCVQEGECYRAFTDIELLEISIVDIPANALSRFTPTKVYITGIDYTPSELVGDNLEKFRGNRYIKWAGAGTEEEGDEPPSPPMSEQPTIPPMNTITLDPDYLEASNSIDGITFEWSGEESNTGEGAKMENEEQDQLEKELADTRERLKVYEEKERLEAEEVAFRERVQGAVDEAVAGKIPENVVTEDTMKSMFEEFLAGQNGSRQSFGSQGEEGLESPIKSREDAFEYLNERYFSKSKLHTKDEYTKGDIEFELWLEARCRDFGKIKDSSEVVHSVQKGGGIMDPHFRDAYEAIMKTTPDDYSSSSTPFGGAASASGLTFMPEGWADEIIELVYEQSFFRQMVDSIIMNEYKIHIPKLTGTMDYYQWTRSSAEGSSDVTESAPTSDEVTLEIQTLLGSVPIGNAVIAYGVAGLGPGIKREMGQRLNWVELHSFINGDTETGSSYGDNINGAYNGTTNPQGVNATHNTHKLMYDGMRKHNFDASDAAEITNVNASGAVIANSHVRNAIKNLGVYGDNRDNLVLVVPKAAEATMLGWTELHTIDKYGPSATIVTGEIGKVYGIPVVSTSVVPENLNASGKFDGTTTDLTVAVMFDKTSPIVGNPGPASRKFSITFYDEPKRDRFALIPRNDVAFNVRRRDAIIQIYNLATTVS